ncbi:uncharacterized protein ARMOST_06518 [Armillaria ostoyae]|uniref:ATP-dependent DNA helicase n=1 Tax=Armillaria ostoyae TaxID=47428 RepID=A0A284R3A1_ARMOS|nr:uncharacterized protein ARMOST_06518 [Armillaria ostoyae]
MGWGDRYISHHYVVIYWDVATAVLRDAYPYLKAKRAYNQETVTQLNGQSESLSGEVTMPVEVVNGQMKLKDQMKEYSDRGDVLEDMCFLDYFLETYDGKPPKKHQDGSESEARSQRVPYREGSGRGKQCRVIRQSGHETLPQFIGRWFARRDRPDIYEYYCAQMMLLLKPWRTMADLKPAEVTFAIAFAEVEATLSAKHKRVLDNIQYFHESSDGAHAKKPETIIGASMLSLDEDDRMDIDIDDMLDNSEQNQFTEVDVDIARSERHPMREVHFGIDAINIAEQAGMFDEICCDTALPSIAPQADDADVMCFWQWEQKLKSITRQRGKDLGHSTPDDRNIINPIRGEGEVEPGGSSEREPQAPPKERILLAKLNTEQKMAHDIIENHLKASIAGRSPSQLLMQVQGQGGTGKTVLINAITETFEYYRVEQKLAKTATSGVAASLIAGQTLHSWGGIPIHPGKDDDWHMKGSKATEAKRKFNMIDKEYLVIDECSMMTKDLLALTSQIIAKHRSHEGRNGHEMFGGMSVILFGDFHQFPPVGNPTAALYHSSIAGATARSIVGQAIYEHFTTVVTLVKQNRVEDTEWNSLLNRLRTGDCTEEDIEELQKLDILKCPDDNYSTFPWNSAILVTSHHGPRERWNAAAI